MELIVNEIDAKKRFQSHTFFFRKISDHIQTNERSKEINSESNQSGTMGNTLKQKLRNMAENLNEKIGTLNKNQTGFL